jgi:S-adenosylmethionine-dependent methyltransferase
MTSIGFETQLDHVRRWRPSPPERLRHRLTEANLARHWGTEPSRVLDVAGGNGVAAVRLAVQGHEVTVLDPAGAVLSAAIEVAEAHGVADRLHVVQAGAQDAPEVFADRDQFDLVLCHNLLHYGESPEERRGILRAVIEPLRAGGLLSVLGPNPDAAPLRAAVRDGSPELALRELAGAASAWSTPCTVGELVASLAELDMAEIVRYGVRCVTDLMSAPDEDDPVLEELELMLADRMPHLLTARYFHLIARR